ncbi:TPA: hypothetical protein ACJYNV_000065 [Neisseria gonorrhoeae]|uniref:hypothetical protein n=1 Tax=Neisseria gonorrhoeae TaxID=485 RepID=UPI001E558110|nr:hypothetical protein [Neisseria gonorrhoeae]
MDFSTSYDYETGFVPSKNMSTDNFIRSLVALWEEPATYVRQFAQAVGSVSEGYFLSWFVEKCLPGEWVSLNNDLLFNEAGITAKQWRNIRNSLLQKGILLNRRTVAPTESQFTLNDALYMVSPPISINKLHLKTLADRGLAFVSILYLSFLQSEAEYQDLSKRGDWSPWTHAAEKHVFYSTMLSRRQQERAIAELTSFGLIESCVDGMPAARRCRYSLKMLADLTSEYLNGCV